MTENSEDDPLKKRTVFLITAFFISVAAIAMISHYDMRTLKARESLDLTDEQILALPYFDVLAPARENTNLECDVVSYSLGDGYIHLFLPDNVAKHSVVVYIRDEDGNRIARRVYDFSQPVKIGDWEILLEHHNLPTIYFESNVPDAFDAMCADLEKTMICGGRITVYAGSDSYGMNIKSIASLQGRGASSWERCNTKKSFSLRMNDSKDLLGLGSNRNWNLIGNAFDASLLKTITFNDISDDIGINFQPRMKNINLYVDGVYQGVYTLSTKVSVDRSRVALTSGDLFFRKQPNILMQPILYDSSTWITEGDEFEYPAVDLLFPENASEDELARATQIFQTFIDNVEDPASKDLSTVCDVRTLARYYWIQEASMNYDAWGRSVYMYYLASDGQMHMGPVWDMDLTLGCPLPKKNAQREPVDYGTPIGWKVRDGGWYAPLFENEEFVAAVKDEYYNGGVREALFAGLDDFERRREELGEDAYTNYLLFGHSNIWEALINYGDTYDEYTDNMISFYRKRLEWIDGQMKPWMI